MLEKTKKLLKKIPVIGPVLLTLKRACTKAFFPGSLAYWDARYQSGGNSGDGSYGRLAQFKARTLNAFVREHGVHSVIEFGCGDGNQLGLAKYPSYIGLDVSERAILQCRKLFEADSSKSFFIYSPNAFLDNAGVFTSELAISLDVVYHLVEDDIYETYMRHLFAAASRFVAIYCSNFERRDAAHVRHRQFTAWVGEHAPGWALAQKVANPYPRIGSEEDGSTSLADLYFFARTKTAAA